MCMGCVLILVTTQVMVNTGGGMAAVYRKIQYNWYNYKSMQKHDPGYCASIGDDTNQGKPGYLREKCFGDYMSLRVQSKNDCATKEIIVDTVSIIKMSPAEWFRQECLLLYYRDFISDVDINASPVCLGLSDRLIELSYYRHNLRSKDASVALSPGKNPFRNDVDRVEDCEYAIKTSI